MKEPGIIDIISNSPVTVMLLKWTLLFGLAWIAHGFVRSRDARWRVVLWRSVLVIAIVLPLSGVIRAPLVQIPVAKKNASPSPGSERAKVAPSSDSAQPKEVPGLPAHVPLPSQTHPASTPAPVIQWSRVLWITWSFGVAAGLIRLRFLQRRLTQLRSRARKSERLDSIVARSISELQVERSVEVRVSAEAQSPFLSGLIRPMIILPESLVNEVSEVKLRAVLRHEFAHLRHNDLPWSLTWRGLALLFWFHPLVWRAPGAHSLACEQEADRLAAGSADERPRYTQLLAEVALQAIGRGIPAVETKLTLNGAAQIVRRLTHLRSGPVLCWKRRHSVAAGGVAAFLALLTAGWQFATAQAADPEEPGDREWKSAVIVVQDEGDKPIAGATVEPYSFRVKGVDSASAYNWATFGPRPRQQTDADGKVTLRYPVVAFPEEKQLTGKIALSIKHSSFSTTNTEISVDDRESILHMARGGSLEVSAYFGPTRQTVEEIVAKVSGDPTPVWRQVRKGVLKCEPLPAGDLMLQIMGRLPSGEIVHSEGTPVTLRKGETRTVALELKPGIRLEGRLDNKIARPVRNGRVIVTVRSQYYPAVPVIDDFYKPQERYGYFHHWSSYRPISEDGTFTFESLPPGEADVIVLGEGFISRNGPLMQNRVNGELVDGPPFGFPQIFPLTAGVTRIEVATEATATLRVSAKTKSGKAVEGATIQLNPNVMRIGTGIFGSLPKPPGEEPFRDVDFLPEPDFSGVTDEEGIAVIKNVPAFLTMLDITHPEYQIPLGKGHGRTVRFKLTPGETRSLDLVLQPKGKDFIGEVDTRRR